MLKQWILLSLLLIIPAAGFGGELREGTLCELSDKAKFFRAATGSESISKLERGTEVILQSLEGARWLAIVGDTKGYLSKKWMQKVCEVHEQPSLPVKGSESAPSAEQKSESRNLDGKTSQDTEDSSEKTNGEEAGTAEQEEASVATEASVLTQAQSGDKSPEVDSTDRERVAGAPALKVDSATSKVEQRPSLEAVALPASSPNNQSSSQNESVVSDKVRLKNQPALVTVMRPSFALHDAFSAKEKIKLLVLDTRVGAVTNLQLDGDGMASLISSELAKVLGDSVDLVSSSDIVTAIERMEEAQLLGCSEPSCMIDIGKLAESDLLLSSRVTPSDDGVLLSLELFDAATGVALRRETVNWKGSAAGLIELCSPQVLKLVDAQRGQSFRGALQLFATEDQAQVYLNEHFIGRTPLEIFANLDIGKHTLRLTKSGFKNLEIPVVVNRDGTSVVQAELTKPWYNEWWVWTAAGALLTGSITAYLIANQGDDAQNPILQLETIPVSGGAR